MPTNRPTVLMNLCAALLAFVAVSCVSSAPSAVNRDPSPERAATDAAPETPAEEQPRPGGFMDRLDARVAPVRQVITLRLDPGQANYSGSTLIDLEVSEAVDEVLFHAQDQELERITLSGSDGEIDVEVERGELGFTRAVVGQRLQPGTYQLAIDFKQGFNTQAVGLYRTEYQDTNYLFTQFQAVDARRAFPCWDEPQYKIRYQLTIEVPEGMEALTNTPIANSQTTDGWTTLEFAETPPTPSYLLAIAVGPFETIEVEGVDYPARIVTVKGFTELGKLAAEMTPPIMSALEEYFGRPYPYAKLDQIAVPEFWPGAMENPGAITYADRILLLRDDAGPRRKRFLAQVMAHEFAHMWFGDLVTMQWWDDLWLNESFAAWMENKIPEQLFPELRPALAGRRATQNIMGRDARPSARAVRRTVTTTHDIFADIGTIYEKGAGVLSMIERWLGEERFQDGVRRYIDGHLWGNATADDFWAALSAASGEDVSSVLAGFIVQPGLPLVSVDDRDGRLWLSQQRFRTAGSDTEDLGWQIPVNVRWQSVGGVQERSLLLGAEPVAFAVTNEVSWVLPDAGAQGYYRWSVPQGGLAKIAQASAELTPRERVALLDNAAALLDAGHLTGADYLELLEVVAADEDPDVLGGVLDGIDKVGAVFVTDQNRSLYAAYLRSALRPIVEQLGWNRRDGEIETTNALRRRLLTTLGVDGRDAEVRAMAREMAGQFLTEAGSVDSEFVAPVLAIAGIDGGRDLFETYRSRFENPTEPDDRRRFLSAMAAFEDPELVQEVRSYSLSDAVKPTEMFAAFRTATSDADADERLSWIFENYDRLKDKVSEQGVGFLPFVAGGCSRARLERGVEFFSDPAHQGPGTLTNLGRVQEQVEECLALREREAPAVAEYLAQFDTN